MFSRKKRRKSNLNRKEFLKFKVLSTQIIYDSEEDEYYTVATCINSYGKIETINIEGFEINDIDYLIGANIECDEEYLEGKLS